MKTEAQSNEALGQLAALIENISVAMMTTQNADAGGALTSRPMSPLLMDSQGALWFSLICARKRLNTFAL